ncbi:transporter [Vibrio sp. Isolate24]|uniref:transporter n=1 Tax=Vibrio sp. Isolate24 TaxID=2908534 RepID=UPI001EFC3CF2|nr:transporter [Vibrio sp. Isolate24]MCG9679898.1 transporter [Vibrio sp. Isolate24]
MEVKLPYLLAPIFLVTSLSAFGQNTAHDLNYDFLYADLSAGSLDENLGVNSNVTSLAVGGNMLLDDQFLATLDYEARFIHPKDTTTERYTLLPGAAFRYSLEDKWDLVAGAKAGFIWSTQTNDVTDEKISSDSKFMWGGDITLKYELSKLWELSVTGGVRRSDILDEDIFNMRGDYQISPKLMLGGFYTHRNNGSTTTNEGGVSLRYLL